DHWFRGINLKYGPDGSVYLIDWYDKNACHRTNPEIWDRTNGRIYNVKYLGTDQAKPSGRGSKSVDLTKLSDAELIKLLDQQNEWYVRMARRLLQERAAIKPPAPQTRQLLVEYINKSTEVTRKLRGYWTLHAMFGAMGDEGHQMLKATG